MYIKNLAFLLLTGISTLWLEIQFISSSLFSGIGNHLGWLFALFIDWSACFSLVWLLLCGYGWLLQIPLQKRPMPMKMPTRNQAGKADISPWP